MTVIYDLAKAKAEVYDTFIVQASLMAIII
jgi:hypothetical protein